MLSGFPSRGEDREGDGKKVLLLSSVSGAAGEQAENRKKRRNDLKEQELNERNRSLLHSVIKCSNNGDGKKMMPEDHH